MQSWGPDLGFLCPKPALYRLSRISSPTPSFYITLKIIHSKTQDFQLLSLKLAIGKECRALAGLQFSPARFFPPPPQPQQSSPMLGLFSKIHILQSRIHLPWASSLSPQRQTSSNLHISLCLSSTKYQHSSHIK